MNAVVGAANASQGGLAITAEVADERICAVRVSSTRPTDLSRLFIDRPAQEAPLLAERIFSLCGVSHRVVAARAIASARQEPVCARRNREEAIALTADGLSAALRANMILALDGDAARSDLDHIRAVGELLSLLRDLASETEARSAEGSENRKKTKALIRNIRALGRDLYARAAQAGAGPASRFPFERLEREFAAGDSFTVGPPDTLGDADDLGNHATDANRGRKLRRHALAARTRAGNRSLRASLGADGLLQGSARCAPASAFHRRHGLLRRARARRERSAGPSRRLPFAA